MTGAASGIGRATAIGFGRIGARLVLADVDEEGGEDAARLARESGAEAVFVKTDVSAPESVDAMMAVAADRFGALTCAVNCAGVEGADHRTADLPVEEWNRVIGVNLTGVFLCMKAQLAVMLEAGAGAIVNISSVAGTLGFRGQGAYSASKHGVLGITRTAALEYARSGIRVNAICPGPVDTPMLNRGARHDPAAIEVLKGYVPAFRISEPEEIAKVAIFLCSDGASYITGQALPVDGGFTAQ